MDIERRRQEASELHRKPRLIEHDEIPAGILKASEEFLEDEKKPQKERLQSLIQPIGRRQRKEVDYSQVSYSLYFYSNCFSILFETINI